MGTWAKRNRSPFRSALAAGILTFCVVGVGMWGCSGNPDHQKPSANQPKPSGEQALVTKLSGEWVKTDSPTTTLYFTKASHKMVYSFKERVKLPGGSRLDPPVYTGEERQNSRTFDFQVAGDNAIKFKASLGDVVIELEFTSDDEFMAIYKSEWNNEPKVQGQFRRKNATVAKAPSNDAQSDRLHCARSGHRPSPPPVRPAAIGANRGVRVAGRSPTRRVTCERPEPQGWDMASVKESVNDTVWRPPSASPANSATVSETLAF